MSDPYRTRVSDGQYRVAYVKCENGVAYGVPRWFVAFTITEEGPNFGIPILRFYNVPRGSFLPRSHNLSIDFMSLMGRRPPRNLKPEMLLKGCEVLAEVVTVRHQTRGSRRVELPEGCWYSKISRFIRITAGSSPLGIRAPGGRPCP